MNIRTEMNMKEITIVLPDELYRKLEEASKKARVSITDIVLHGIIKAIEEVGV